MGESTDTFYSIPLNIDLQPWEEEEVAGVFQSRRWGASVKVSRRTKVDVPTYLTWLFKLAYG